LGEEQEGGMLVWLWNLQLLDALICHIVLLVWQFDIISCPEYAFPSFMTDLNDDWNLGSLQNCLPKAAAFMVLLPIELLEFSTSSTTHNDLVHDTYFLYESNTNQEILQLPNVMNSILILDFRIIGHQSPNFCHSSF